MRFVLAALLVTLPVRAAVSFKAQIAPILLEKCVACHGAEKSKGGFRLDSFGALVKGGESKEAAIVGGAPEKSHLFELITTKDEDDRMPQKSDRLSDQQIALIRDWISEGANFDGSTAEENLAKIVPYQPGPDAPAHYPFPQPTLALAWSIDGKTLASSGYHEALIWSEDGKLQKRISRLPQRVHGLAFVDANTIAVTAGTPGKWGEALMCRIDSTEPPRLLARLTDVATCLAIDKKRTMIAVGGADNSIHIFELPTGNERVVIQQHADWVTALAFSNDGSELASASRDRTARIFAAKTGDLLETYAEHVQPLYCVAFSEDGKTVFSGGREKKIHSWQAHEAKKNGEFPALDGDVLALCVTGSQLFAAGGDKQIHVFGATDRKQIRTLDGHTDWIYTLAWHEGSKRLASGSFDGEIRIWDVEKGKSVSAFRAVP
jgi:WD40 repeat protein